MEAKTKDLWVFIEMVPRRKSVWNSSIPAAALLTSRVASW